MVRYSESGDADRANVVAETKAIGLGRFTEAAVRHVTSKLSNREFGETAWALLNATRPENAAGKPFALK